MKKVYVEKLAVPFEQALPELKSTYEALKQAAQRENNLHAFLSAELTLATLEMATNMLRQPKCYGDKAHYLTAEPEDSAERLFQERCRFVYNAAFA